MNPLTSLPLPRAAARSLFTRPAGSPRTQTLLGVLAWLFAVGAVLGAPAGQDLYVDSTDPGQGSSVPGQTVVYAGPSVTVTGSSTFDDAYAGYNGLGALTQADGTLTINHSFYFGHNAGSAGTYSLSGGTFNLGFILYLGYYGQGAFMQTGGVSNVNALNIGWNTGSIGEYALSGGALSAGRVAIGQGGVGKFVQTGGSLETDTLSIEGFDAGTSGSYRLSGLGTVSTNGMSVGFGGTGSFLQSGGRLTTNGNKLSIGDGNGTGNYTLSDGNLFTGFTYVANGGSADTFAQSGGLHFTNVVQLTEGNSTYSLDGGTLKATKVFAYKTVITYIGGTHQTSTSFPVTTYVPGAGTFNFNGGALQASDSTYGVYDPSNQSGLITGIAQANVRNGGAVIDTQALSVTANQALSHSAVAGDAAIDGGLTKLGTGTLTLAAASTYNGGTTIRAGTLMAAANGSLGDGDVTVTAASTLSVGSSVVAAHNTNAGTTLTLADATTSLVNLAGRGVQDTVAALVINGVPQPAGTYGAPGSGATHTDVANFRGTGQLWVAPNGAPHPHFFDGEVALGSGVYYVPFAGGLPFGYYAFLSDPRYLYHFDMGYEYWFDANDGRSGIYFYDFQTGDFFYTSPNFPFPYLYSFNLQTVLYYYPDPTRVDRYNTGGVRYFYNFNTGQIIQY